MLYSSSISHPIMFSANTGKTLLDDTIPSINRSIALILKTSKGELFGDPLYGSNLYTLLFNTNTPQYEDAIKQEVFESVITFEHRISFDISNVATNFSDGSVHIEIDYQVTGSDQWYTTSIDFREGEYNGNF